MAYTQDYINQLVREAAQQAGGTLSYADLLHAGNNLGIPEAQLLNSISTGVVTDYGNYVNKQPEAKSITDIWQKEAGIAPADIDTALSLAHLRAGGSLESGQKFLNDSRQGQAYDSYLAQFPASQASQASYGSFLTPTNPNVSQFDTPTLDFNPEVAAVSNGGREWSAPETVGASNGQLMGAGNANYNSALIKSLRQNSMTPISTNPGVQVTPNAGQTTVNWTPPAGIGSAFNPQIFNPRAATPQEINDYNAYSAYRSSAVGGSSPYMSLVDWIGAGRPSQVRENLIFGNAEGSANQNG